MRPPLREHGADLIGGDTRSYTTAQLAARSPRAGDGLTFRITLGGPCGHQEPGEGGYVTNPLSPTGPEYTFHIVIRRVEDGPPVNDAIR
jgi:hypothetical protein